MVDSVVSVENSNKMLNSKVWPGSQWFKKLKIKNIMDMPLVLNPQPDKRSRKKNGKD